MKCDELKRHSIRGVMFNGEEICGGFAYYDADEVDAAIAELKNEINRKEGVELRWFDRCMEARAENVKLKRALYKACANWAKAYRYPSFRKFESRCLKMAEKYK